MSGISSTWLWQWLTDIGLSLWVGLGTSCAVLIIWGSELSLLGGPEFVDAGLCGAVVIMRDGERESNTAAAGVDPGAEAIDIGERERGIST